MIAASMPIPTALIIITLVFTWNYSIGYNTRLDKYVICGYRIPQSVLNAAKSVIKMAQKEAYLHA
jgi:hypothetical protein